MEPLYLFSLPSALLGTLVPRVLGSVLHPESPATPLNTLVQLEVESSLPATSLPVRSCNICPGASHVHLDDQRLHYRSDWHRYNVKMKLVDKIPVSETTFVQLLDGLEDSLSGSASSDEDDDASDGSLDVVQALFQKTNLGNPSHPDDSGSVTFPTPKTAISWFHSPPSTQIGVYNSIFSPSQSPCQNLDELKQIQRCGPQGRLWTMLMVAGGHFAGMIVRVASPRTNNDESSILGPISRTRHKSKMSVGFEILNHKTFHRYTTRRKQGGSQSTNDKSKGHAISAGAMLRRYGEQALRDDIRGLLENWSEQVKMSERIWIRASVSNRKIFWDYDNAVIRKTDARIRGFPFPTRRPTQTELTRCLQELTQPKLSHLTEEALQTQDDEYLASLPKPKPDPVPSEATRPVIVVSEPRWTVEQETVISKWQKIHEMIRKGRLESLKVFWEREGVSLGGINMTSPEWWEEERPMTLLHVASSAGQPEIVGWLLEEQHASPLIGVPAFSGSGTATDQVHEQTKMVTAYDIASSKEVRNVFRRCADSQPDTWDWFGEGHVPSGLSKAMEEEREEKRRARRKGLKERARERLAQEQTTPEPVAESVQTTNSTWSESTAWQKLGGKGGREGDLKGLSSEMVARIEREKRARAAEARMKGMSNSKG